MYLIKTAKSVDIAVEEALQELGVTRDEVEVEILEEASKGFLGLIGSKEATVKVSVVKDAKDIVKEIFYEDVYEEVSPKTEVELTDIKEVEDEKTPLKEKVEEVLEEVESEDTLEVEDEKNEMDFSIIEKTVYEFMDKVLNSLSLSYELEIEREDNVLRVNILGNEEELGIVIGKRGLTLDAIQYLLSLLVNKKSNTFIRVIVDASGYRKKREITLTKLAKKSAQRVVRTNRSFKLEPMSAQERRIIHYALQDFEGVSTHSEGKDPYRRVVIQVQREY